MMHGHEKSDSVIVAVKPTNKAERCGAGEPRAEAKGNADQHSTHRAQYRVRVAQALACIRRIIAVDTRGGRSYGAGGGGCGTFIVHTNRWRLPRGPNQ
jgi:hypothetical protein